MKLTAGNQTARQLSKDIEVHVIMNYLLYLPEQYSNEDKWPVLFFLHGKGERGSDLELVKMHGPPKLITGGHHFPFIVVSPQCPDDQWWSIEVLNALVDDIIENYRIDKNRVYLTGLSMGGYGTWALATEYPEKFAAIAPICGGGKPEQADNLKSMPIWVFHGAKDTTVPLSESQKMVDALKKAGNEPKFTVYEDADHDSWTVTYNNDQLYEWFLAQKK